MVLKQTKERIEEIAMTKPEEQRRSIENLRLSLLNFVSKLSRQDQTLKFSSFAPE